MSFIFKCGLVAVIAAASMLGGIAVGLRLESQSREKSESDHWADYSRLVDRIKELESHD